MHERGWEETGQSQHMHAHIYLPKMICSEPGKWKTQNRNALLLQAPLCNMSNSMGAPIRMPPHHEEGIPKSPSLINPDW
jgi:hypothetical protein